MPVCQAKHRARFFQLVDVFLASGLVPAYTAAAFAKRFARLALAAPPAGAAIAVAFVHNLLRRHPACNILLHRYGPCACSLNVSSPSPFSMISYICYITMTVSIARARTSSNHIC